MSALARLENELAQRQDDLATCHEMLALEPDSADALESIPLLEADIADLKAQIAAHKAKQSAASPTPPPPPPPSDAAALPPPPPPAAEEPVAVFNVKDVVMAKFSEDKQWYQATIVTKTGSSTDPVYKVTFKGYGNTETKRKHEIRAIVENSKKRKADGPPAGNSSSSTTTPVVKPISNVAQNGSVISAAASVDTTLVKKREPSKVSDGPTRLPPEPKKLKGSKPLEKAKSSWQDFQKNGPKKGGAGMAKQMAKDSQFRTPDLPGAKGEFFPTSVFPENRLS